MKLIKFLFCALVSMTLASCGGDKNSAKLEIKEELAGLAQFISLDKDEVSLTLGEGMEDGEAIVSLSATIPFTVKQDVASDYSFSLEGEILDKNLNKVADLTSDFDIESQTDYNNDGFSHILTKGEHRAVSEMKVSKSKWDNTPEAKILWERIRTEGKYLVVKIAYSSAKFKAYTGSGESDSEVSEEEWEVDSVAVESSSTGSSTDWDSVLDEYERYVTKAASLYKKVQSGDMSAMTEYASLLESAQSLNSKLENAKNDMTPAQVARLNKIVAKMSQSMM